MDKKLTVLDCSQVSLFRPDDRSSMEKKDVGLVRSWLWKRVVEV